MRERQKGETQRRGILAPNEWQVLASWHFLCNLVQVRSCDRVLILGGVGSLGSAAVQISANMSAEMTATCSARNTDLVASLGATRACARPDCAM